MSVEQRGFHFADSFSNGLEESLRKVSSAIINDKESINLVFKHYNILGNNLKRHINKVIYHYDNCGD